MCAHSTMDATMDDRREYRSVAWVRVESVGRSSTFGTSSRRGCFEGVFGVFVMKAPILVGS